MAESLRKKVTKKKEIMWLIIILLLFLIIAALLFFFYRPKGTQTQVPGTNVNTNQQPVTNQTVPNQFNTPDTNVLADLQAINNKPEADQKELENILFFASSFAERFGSYSNQGEYKNFDELDPFMTDTLKKWAVTYKDSLKKQNADTSIYYAIETKVISNVVNNLDEEKGEIMFKTQRQEFKTSLTNPRVFYQNVLIKLVKMDKDWKVDGAYWQ
jgi:hypothetical protein